MSEEQSPSEGQTLEKLASYFSKPEGQSQPPEAADAEPQVEASEDPQQAEEPEDDGHDDFDVDGTVYRIPRDLKAKASEWKDGYLRREDYTRKTQDVGDLHRSAQLQVEAIQLRESFEKEASKELRQLASTEEKLAEFKQVDWLSLDTDTHMKLRSQYETLKDRAQELRQTLQGKASELEQKLTSHKQQLEQEGVKFLARNIPGYNQHTLEHAKSGAKAVGYQDQEVKNVLDARFHLLSWKAAQWDKISSEKATAVTKVQKAPPVVKPGATQPGMAAQASYQKDREILKKDGNNKDAVMRLLIARKFK